MIINPIEELAPEESLEHPPASCQQLRHLLGRAHAAWEREKSVVARQLHDDFAQKLTALSIEMTLLDHTLGEGDAQEASPQAVRQRLRNMAEVVGSLIKSTRKLTTELHPRILDEFGLKAGLQWQTQEFTHRTGIRSEFVCETEDLPLDPQRSTELFRIQQEILLNVARHAKASRVEVHLRTEADSLILHVQDDGCGISEEDLSSPESLGLAGIRERARLLGGELRIHSIPSDGTLHTLEVPLNAPGSAPGPHN